MGGAIGPIIGMLLLSVINIFIIYIGFNLLYTTFELNTWVVITIMFFGWSIAMYHVYYWTYNRNFIYFFSNGENNV